MSEKPVETELTCSRCQVNGSGRVTPKFLESIGWRKVNGEWICNLCSGAGYGGFYRRDPDEGGSAASPTPAPGGGT